MLHQNRGHDRVYKDQKFCCKHLEYAYHWKSALDMRTDMQTAFSDTSERALNTRDANHFAQFGALLLPLQVIREERARLDEREFGGRSTGGEAPASEEQSDPMANRSGPRWKKPKASHVHEWQEPLSLHSGPKFRVIQRQDVEDHAEILESQPKDENYEKSVALLRSLLPLGELRKLHYRPLEWKTKLELLEARFPHFAEVIEHVRISCALSERAALDTISLDHLILSGPPGIGKTYFCSFLAAFLRGESAPGRTLTIRMADQQTNASIAGSDSFWSNSKPSSVFEELMFKGFANPIIILDELDKTAGDHRFDPLSPLYTIWDRTSAKDWKDLCFPWLAINASRITWLATCNTIRTLPEPILSRAQVFHINAPSEDEAVALAEIIAWESTQELLPDDPVEFSDAAIKALSRLSPRRQRAAIKTALGAVALRQSDVVHAADIPSDATSTRMGFV
ncbi:MAG: AAA family ATPase [Pseudomonadota bacterium]